MYIDCHTQPEVAARYCVVDADSGTEIHDCFTACEEEGWVLIVETTRWNALTMTHPPCRLEFRRIRIEKMPVAQCCDTNVSDSIGYDPFLTGDEVTIRSTAPNLGGCNGLTGVIDRLIDTSSDVAGVPGGEMFYSVRISHRDSYVLCRAEDLTRAMIRIGDDDLDVGRMVSHRV